MDRRRRKRKKLLKPMLAGLLIGAVSRPALVSAQRGEFDVASVSPPAVLANVLEPASGDDDAAKRRVLTWEQVLASVEPAALPERIASKQAMPLDGAAGELLDEADRSITRGDLFKAIGLLREAEALTTHPQLDRALGVAYSLAGNRVRGAGYLERSLAQRSDDAAALLLLSRHYALRGALPKALAYTDALAKAGPPGVLADYYRSVALTQAGYTTAAAQRLQQAVAGLETLPEQAEPAGDALVARELRVLAASRSDLGVRLGDLYLSLGKPVLAGQQYDKLDAHAVSGQGVLLARRVYLALVAEEVDRAIALALTELDGTEVNRDKATMIGYLAEQGVPNVKLSWALETLIAEKGVSIPLLEALARFADKAVVIDTAQRWLTEQPAKPEVYRAVVALMPFDDGDQADVAQLARLLTLTADRMRQDPLLAPQYARASVQEVGALVCLLRALREPAFADPQDAYRQLLSAAACEHAGRLSEAAGYYRRAIAQEPALVAGARLSLARLLIEKGRPSEALEVLEAAGEASGWEWFKLTALAVSRSGDPARAIRMVDDWRRGRGQDRRSSLLRIELVAQAGNPQLACDQLLRLISASPKQESLYRVGLDLVDRHVDAFKNFNEASNTRAMIISRLRANLPDSVQARTDRAFDIYTNPDRLNESRALLRSVVADDPGNVFAWTMLVRVYEQLGDEAGADEAHASLVLAKPPGASRALTRAGRAVSQGDMEVASKTLRQLFKLEEEGVLPGPAMTGDQAARVLQLLASAEPDTDLESLSLKLVCRFPDNAMLNNSLGYQWTVAGKNLLQAQAMIKRALKEGGDSHSVMDSLAWVQYKLGRFDEAEATQRRAIDLLREAQLRINDQLRPSKAVLYDHMGDIMYRKGESASAIRHWQIARAQRLAPEDLMFDPELRTLADRVDAKIDAIRSRKPPPVEPVPGLESHGLPGHPADQGG